MTRLKKITLQEIEVDASSAPFFSVHVDGVNTGLGVSLNPECIAATAEVALLHNIDVIAMIGEALSDELKQHFHLSKEELIIAAQLIKLKIQEGVQNDE